MVRVSREGRRDGLHAKRSHRFLTVPVLYRSVCQTDQMVFWI